MAVEPGQRAVLVLAASRLRTVAGEVGENLRRGNLVAGDFPADPLAEEKQRVGAGLELRTVGPSPT